MRTFFAIAIGGSVIGCSTVILEQGLVTGYHDVGTNGQQITLESGGTIDAVELTMFGRGAPGNRKGSDVLVLLVDSTDDSLVSHGLIERNEIPLNSGRWVRCRLRNKAVLRPSVTYVLRVLEVSSGGVKGWNEYGFGSGDPYPDGMLVQDFNSKDRMDYAFRLSR